MNRISTLLVAAILVCSAFGSDATTSRGEVRSAAKDTVQAIVFSSGQAPPARTELEQLGAEVVGEYDAYTHVRISSTAAESFGRELESRGRFAQIQADWDLIKTPNRTIDARGIESVLIDDLPGEGLFVVQFRGPARSEWFESMTESAVRFVGYVPHNAALVHATRESLARFIAANGLNLQYVGVFDETMKHQPIHLFSSSRGTVKYRIQLVDVPSSSDVVEQLKSVYAAEEVVRYGGYVLLEAYLEPSDVMVVLREPGIVAVEERGEDRLSGEREALGLSNQPITGNTYRTWLTNTGVLNTGNYKIAVADTGLSGGNTGTIHEDFTGTGKPSPGTTMIPPTAMISTVTVPPSQAWRWEIPGADWVSRFRILAHSGMGWG